VQLDQEHINEYLVKICKSYLIVATVVFFMLLMAFLDNNQVLLFPVIANLMLLYLLKYNMNVEIVAHTFVVYTLVTLLLLPLYINVDSILSFYIVFLFFSYITFSIHKLKYSLMYTSALFVSIYFINISFPILDFMSMNTMIVVLISFFVSSIFFLLFRKYQIEKIQSILDSSKDEIRSCEKVIDSSNERIKELLIENENLKIRDDRTNFYKESIFTELLNNEISKHVRHGQTLSFLNIKINHIDQFIKKYGIEASDAMITSFANILNDIIRHSDIVGHIDNDVFQCISPHTSSENATILIDRIVDKVQNSKINGISVNISIGCTSLDGKDHDIQVVIDNKENSLSDILISEVKKATENAALNQKTVEIIK